MSGAAGFIQSLFFERLITHPLSRPLATLAFSYVLGPLLRKGRGLLVKMALSMFNAFLSLLPYKRFEKGMWEKVAIFGTKVVESKIVPLTQFLGKFFCTSLKEKEAINQSKKEK